MTTHLTLASLTTSKIAQGKHALLDEDEADRRHALGDRYGAIGRRQTADAAWARVFDHIPADGAHLDRMRART
jgi:hypothetical protein